MAGWGRADFGFDRVDRSTMVERPDLIHPPAKAAMNLTACGLIIAAFSRLSLLGPRDILIGQGGQPRHWSIFPYIHIFRFVMFEMRPYRHTLAQHFPNGRYAEYHIRHCRRSLLHSCNSPVSYSGRFCQYCTEYSQVSTTPYSWC